MGSNGNNLHEAVTESGERFLLSMPTKFRKNIWIKRGLLKYGFLMHSIILVFLIRNTHGLYFTILLSGDFVIVDPIEEGDKVKGEISFILYRDHIHYLRKLGIW